MLTESGLGFVTERHLATFTSLRADGSPHVTPVGFTWDDAACLARVITSGTTVKAHNAARGGIVALCQVDGRRWLVLEGTTLVRADPASVRDAEQRYAQRYRTPRVNPRRVVVEIAVQRTYGTAEFLTSSG